MPGYPGSPALEALLKHHSTSNVPLNNHGGGMTVNWREFTQRSGGSPPELAFGPNMTRASMMIDVPFSQVETAVRDIVGYAVPGAAPNVIKRYIPMQHPIHYWLWAKSVPSVRYPGKVVSLSKSVHNNMTFSDYDFARLTIEFWQPPYAIVADGGTQNEWERYTEWLPEQSGEFISRKKGSFKWVDGGPQNGQVFPGSKSMYLPKKRIRVIWHQVPEKKLFPSLALGNGNFTSPLDAYEGRVNSAAWAGYPAGTVLFEAWGATPEPWPVSPQTMVLDLKVSRLWNVNMAFLHFDPPYGNVNNRGHNLHPQQDNLWYKITAAGGANLPYPQLDLNNLWKLV